MRIKSVEFAGAIGQLGQAAPEAARGVPQVAFAGRSNVGKSSLINRILGRTRTAIARVSQQPGKTQEINFYSVRSDRGEFFLVDLPGYGYAKVPQELRSRWQPLIHGYISRSEELRGVVQLLDVRTGPTPDDLKAIEYLAELQMPVLFALTKADKLNRTKRDEALRETVRTLGVDPEQVILFSALKGDGTEELLDSLGGLLFADENEPGMDETTASEPAEPSEAANGESWS